MTIALDANNFDVKVKISSKWAKHLFSCSPEYVVNHCRGRCCEGSNNILISLLPKEAEKQESLGFAVRDGLLLPDPDTGKCPHKQNNGLCGIHGTALKPFGCITSPFTLNSSNTLIIRNRYIMMECHGQGEPAYKTFRTSLDLILGQSEAGRICSHLENGDGDIIAHIPHKAYDSLKYLDRLKHDNRCRQMVMELGV